MKRINRSYVTNGILFPLDNLPQFCLVPKYILDHILGIISCNCVLDDVSYDDVERLLKAAPWDDINFFFSFVMK